MAPPTRTPASTWIQAGLRALADGGPGAVRIDRLARPASAGMRFTPRALPAKDAAAYVERSIAGGSEHRRKE